MQKHSWRIAATQQGAALDRFLANVLHKSPGREIALGQVRKLIEAGAVSLDGRRERSVSKTLKAGMRVEVFVDLAKFATSSLQEPARTVSKIFAWSPARILFEDEWLIVVDKPVGLPTQPTLDESRANVFGTLKAFLQKRDGGSPYLGLHHRLDRDTSGVLLFTKSEKANAGVAELFASRALQKTYQALCLAKSSCPDDWEVKNCLGVVTRAGRNSKFGAVRSGGDPAHTSFKVLERFPGVLLVEARPHTGRTHQIRVHLAEDGRPIMGDIFYGGPAVLKPVAGTAVHFPRVMLHAAALAFSHPITKAELTVRSPLPEDFAGCLAQIRKIPGVL